MYYNSYSLQNRMLLNWRLLVSIWMLSNQHVNGMTQFVGKLAKLHVLLLDTLEYVIYFDWFEVFSNTELPFVVSFAIRRIECDWKHLKAHSWEKFANEIIKVFCKQKLKAMWLIEVDDESTSTYWILNNAVYVLKHCMN